MALHNKTYIKREGYLQKASGFLHKDMIKFFTGQRRTGKSYLMLQLMDEIRDNDPDANIVFIDMELMAFGFIKNADDLMVYYQGQAKGNAYTYLFIDEVQEIKGFERALRSLLNEGKTDIWCSGSNAEILSGELSDRLSGRSIEIRVHGLSYLEFLKFHSLADTDESLEKYMKFGGMPNLASFPLDQDVAYDYLQTINSTVLLKDIVKRHQIRNVQVLENLIKFMADNLGSLFSVASISNFLKSQGQKISPSVLTNYISYFLDTFYLLRVPRVDVKGKKIFETNEKYYFEDLGLRNAWTAYQPMHINKMIENTVFKHLLHQGFRIFVGQMGNLEIDFVAEKPDMKIYVQCAYLITDEKTREREFGNLLKIKDNYRKMVVSMDNPSGGNIKGIEHIHLRGFLKTFF